MNRKRILVKITGKALENPATGELSIELIRSVLQDMQKYTPEYQFGIVIGGGNIMRGNEKSAHLGISESAGHLIGMLATTINGILISDIAQQLNIPAVQLSAIPMPTIAEYIAPYTLDGTYTSYDICIFTGGTGNPYVTTDTAAIIRALQFNAQIIWKATSVDGIFTTDPKKDPHAQYIKNITYKEAQQQHLGILDQAAYALAQEHALPIRVFNIRQPHAITRALTDSNFGSIISP